MGWRESWKLCSLRGRASARLRLLSLLKPRMGAIEAIEIVRGQQVALAKSKVGLRAIVARREKWEMDRVLIVALVFATLLLVVSAKKSSDVMDLQIGVKYKLETYSIQSHKVDRVKVHYRGYPIEFELGNFQVIKGWDQGQLGMCVGEKRKLKIPSKLGYAAQGSPPKIPGGATLIFDTELVAVIGKTSSINQSTEGNEEL
ncbi:hypothetical protein IEQ34_000351 [Dendrobium chrysotoxum]|uniref:peptidylprolyl isomerase n=1 Tax=Dendrobium chrysotoxum TaxID=161865 RepID=A0AAV7HSU0_DENCH|nr:hypothetical protein IEQ34_000351 [Dendrobium chrysotoxum]